jgi:membrane-associated protease RseP (regulator of RpoE activity)
MDEHEPVLRLRVADPASVWAVSGLRTGDKLGTINGKPIQSWPELRTFLTTMAVGDTATFVVHRDSGPFTTKVVMKQLVEPRVEIERVENATARQQRLLRAWVSVN